MLQSLKEIYDLALNPRYPTGIQACVALYSIKKYLEVQISHIMSSAGQYYITAESKALFLTSFR